MYTTEYNDTHLEPLLNPLRDIFKEYIVELKENEDIIEIKNDLGFSCMVEIDKEELLAELGFQRDSGNYYTITETSLRVLLIDKFGNAGMFLDGGSEKRLTDATHGLTITLKSAKESSLLTLSNINLIKNHIEVEDNQVYTLENLIEEDFVICEFKFENSFNYQEVSENVEMYINSLITHLSFQKNILLENPIDLSYSFEVGNPLTDNSFTFSTLNEKEPLSYFLFAEKTEYIHLKFLEYYHVIEYYFYQRRILQMEDILERLINARLLNRTADRQAYYDDLNNIWESYYVVNNSKLNEIDELKYIFNNQIGFDLIVYSLSQIPDFEKTLSKEACDIKDTKVELSKVSKKVSGNQIFNNNNNIEDKAKFCNELASRIYKLRNYIVHSKKFGSDTLFLSSREQLESLNKELPIIRSLAYLMLRNTF